LALNGYVEPRPRVHYVDHAFRVEPGAAAIQARLTFFKHDQSHNHLFLALFDPHTFRGARMQPDAKGQVELVLWVAPDDASEGGLPGALPAGEWRALVDVGYLAEGQDYRLEVRAVYGDAPAAVPLICPAGHVVKPGAGWYKGELHAHSSESDGKYPVATMVSAARAAGLDFLSLTEHFTVSQWRKLAPLVNDRTALIRACEVTSHHGHANLQGLTEWVDVYVDRPGWSMNDVADVAHAQGALFCINHAYSGGLGWRAYDFDWAKADLFEIYHNLEGSNNNHQMPLWDRLLAAGHRVVGVGGTDSHDPFTGLHALGQLVTWVYADKLSEAGILAGLRRGQVYVSRGPQLRFDAANAAGAPAAMGQSLAAGGDPITFTAQALVDRPMRLIVLRDGLPFDTWELPAGDGWQSVTFQDAPRQRAFYRVELHTYPNAEGFQYIEWRDFTTFQAASNPIWANA
jgi:hypothetical protein